MTPAHSFDGSSRDVNEVETVTREKMLVPVELIEGKILLIRGQKVMLSNHLAELYGVTTSALIQAVRRNIERFPKDFMFLLTRQEILELITVCDRFQDQTCA